MYDKDDRLEVLQANERNYFSAELTPLNYPLPNSHIPNSKSKLFFVNCNIVFCLYMYFLKVARCPVLESKFLKI